MDLSLFYPDAKPFKLTGEIRNIPSITLAETLGLKLRIAEETTSTEPNENVLFYKDDEVAMVRTSQEVVSVANIYLETIGKILHIHLGSEPLDT